MGNDFLFTRIKQGDEKALEKFTKENYLFFCALANRYVNDVQEAEDIVQELFISVWNKRLDDMPEKEFAAYMTTSVRNSCVSFLRKRRDDTVSIDVQVNPFISCPKKRKTIFSTFSSRKKATVCFSMR